MPSSLLDSFGRPIDCPSMSSCDCIPSASKMICGTNGARRLMKRLLFCTLRAPNQPVKRGMTGEQRMLGYRVAVATGLRANELRSLTRDSFDLPNRAIWLRAAYDKRKRRTRQPIPRWLADELQDWFDTGGGLWSGFTQQNPGRLLKEDLIAAGIPPCIEGPDGDLFFDFHSLRHWYCTWAANLPGISPKSLMTLCRHSTPALTMKVYAKARIHDLESAVEQMPAIQPDCAGISPSKPDEQSRIS